MKNSASLSNSRNGHRIRFGVNAYSPNQLVRICFQQKDQSDDSTTHYEVAVSNAQITLIREFINLRAKGVEAQCWIEWDSKEESLQYPEKYFLIKRADIFFEVTNLGITVDKEPQVSF